MFLGEPTIGKEHSRGHEHVDREKKGTYTNFGMLAESYGIHYNRELAIKRAVTASTKCVMMKGNWLNWDAVGECTEYLRLNKEFEDLFRERWNMYEKPEEPAGGDDDDNDDEDGDGPSSKGTRQRAFVSQLTAAARVTQKLIAKRGGVESSASSPAGKAKAKEKKTPKAKAGSSKRIGSPADEELSAKKEVR